MPNEVKIRPYCNDDLEGFKEMFRDYFINDFKIEISDIKIDKICPKIAEQSILAITPLDMLLVDNKLVGFICYQIDSSNSDWCEREGWGFIREIYVNTMLRGSKLGSKLVAHAEKMLYSNGIKHIYLTSDEADEFWISCGYMKTAKVSDINHDPIYEKLIR